MAATVAAASTIARTAAWRTGQSRTRTPDADAPRRAAELRAAFAHFNAHGAGGDRIRNDEIDELVDAAHADERGLIRIADLVDAMMAP